MTADGLRPLGAVLAITRRYGGASEDQTGQPGGGHCGVQELGILLKKVDCVPGFGERGNMRVVVGVGEANLEAHKRCNGWRLVGVLPDAFYRFTNGQKLGRITTEWQDNYTL